MNCTLGYLPGKYTGTVNYGGIMEGFGRFVVDDGSSFLESQFLDGVPHGYFRSYSETGSYTIGVYN